jgi:hypothetical protein
MLFGYAGYRFKYTRLLCARVARKGSGQVAQGRHAA